MRIFLLAVLASLTVIPIATAAAPNSHQYIVKLKSVQTNPSAPASIHAVVGSLGGHIDFDWNDRIVVTIPDAAVAALRAHGQVKYLQRVISGPFVATATTNLEGLSIKLDLATISNSSPPWNSGTYSYDGAGNIRAIGPGSVSNDNFEYDGLSRLMRANIRNHSQSYTYDAFGNLSSISTDSSPSVFQVDQSTNHLIASPSGGSERYDTAGNDTGDGSSQTFYYDPFNMMRQKDIAASNTTTFFVYTANDERIGVITCPLGGGACGAAPSFWTWSLRDEDGKVLRQFQAAYTNISTPWTWIEDYVYRDGLLLGAERVPEEGGRRHFHLDHLGSPRLVTGDSGQRMAEHDYYPFGVEIPQAFQDTAAGYDREEPMRFTGHERDFNLSTLTENANYNDDMLARQTIPAWGRFLSVDPVLGDPHQPQSWNRYAYVMNNPINRVDRDGRWSFAAAYAAASDKLEIAATGVDAVAAFVRSTVGPGNGVTIATDAVAGGLHDASATLKLGTTIGALQSNAGLTDVVNASAIEAGRAGKGVLVLAAALSPIISMDEAVSRGAAHVDGTGVVDTTKGGNFQFRNTFTNAAGETESRMARFDVNPADPHVQSGGPHLNLEIHVNGAQTSNTHLRIDAATLRPGDFPP